MLDEGSGDVAAVFDEHRFEFDRVLKRAAVGHLPGRIHQRIFADARWHQFACAPLANGVVFVERQSQRIDVAMACSTTGIFGVCFDSLADRDLVSRRRNRFDRIDVGRRRRRGLVEDRFADPHAPMHRSMPSPIRRQSEHRAHRQQSASMIFRLESDALKAARRRFR